MRKLLFTPLNNRKDLHAWIKLFLDLDMPDSIVDWDSNCSPMDAIWEAYNEAQQKEPKFTRVLYYASRDSFKTLSQSIFECLSILHLNRDIVHLAAIEEQSKKAQSYIKSFFNRPYLRDFMNANNRREFEIVRFYNEKTGDYLNVKEWGKLSALDKNNYDEIKNKTTVIVATLKSTNGQHGNLALDELDLIDKPAVYEEAKMIPNVINGRLPITYMTSSRKIAYGLVQKEIDLAEKTGLRVGHWNAIDVSQGCPAERHRPDLPKLSLYRDPTELRSYTQDRFELLTDKEKSNCIKEEAYAGCATCPLHAMCRSALATRQTSQSPLLRPILHTINLFAQVDRDVAKAQLLCLMPSNEGMIYGRLDPKIHFKTSEEIVEMVTGANPGEKVDKKYLVNILKSMENSKFFVGMDFGFTHKFAVVLGCVVGNRCFILEAFEEPELELTDQINLCNERILHYNPIIYADTAYPAYIKTFKRHGYQMRRWDKGKDSVVGGIEIVRQKIMSSLGEPELFFLKDDPSIESAFKILREYHWQTDLQGNVTDEPDKVNDDICDALRYMIMNAFSPRNRILGAHNENVRAEQAPNHQEWMQKIINEALNKDDSVDEDAPRDGGSGKFRWSF